MEEQRQEKKLRLIEGVVDRGYLSQPKKNQHNGDEWESYTCHVRGKFKDTQEMFDGWINSKYPVAIYDARTQELYPDQHQLDMATFEAEIAVTQQDGKRPYLYAINYKKLLEEATAYTDPFKVNPFIQLETPQQAPAQAAPTQTPKASSTALSPDDVPF